MYWGPAFRVAPTFYIGAFHWPKRQVVVINHLHYRPAPVFYRSRSLARHHSAAHWHHKPQHRRGVAYQDQRNSSFDGGVGSGGVVIAPPNPNIAAS